jgi:hypothetical protein
MARIRTIKPTFFRSRSVKKLTDKAKLSWIALWNLADDEGRLLDELGILTGDLWSLSLSEKNLDKVLDELHTHGRIVRYEVAGQAFIQVTGWEHQRINRPTPSLLPPVPISARSLRAPASLTVGREGKGRDKEGEASFDAEPPLFCSAHTGNPTTANCRQCADARRVHAAWASAKKNRPTVPGIITDPDCEIHLGYPKLHCPRCAEEAAA